MNTVTASLERRLLRTDGGLADIFAGLQPEPWMSQALCAETDPELFFPEKGGSTREAKKVCAACPVAAECLEWALSNREPFGIFGGFSERERERLRRGESLSRFGVCAHCGGSTVRSKYCGRSCQERARRMRRKQVAAA